MKTGERIKTIRKSQGITQAKLAETLHISSSFMSRIENGSSSLTLDFVCEIADALQVTRQEVLRDVFTYTKDDSMTYWSYGMAGNVWTKPLNLCLK